MEINLAPRSTAALIDSRREAIITSRVNKSKVIDIPTERSTVYLTTDNIDSNEENSKAKQIRRSTIVAPLKLSVPSLESENEVLASKVLEFLMF